MCIKELEAAGQSSMICVQMSAELVKRGELPVITFGKRLLIPKSLEEMETV